MDATTLCVVLLGSLWVHRGNEIGTPEPTGLSPSTVADSQPVRSLEALAWAQRLQMHDERIGSIEWDQEIWTVPDVSGASWQRYLLSEEGQAGDGRWYRTILKEATWTRDGRELISRGQMVFDRERLWTFGPDQNSGTIRPLADERMGIPGLPALLGRQIDWAHRRRLGELLLDARSLKVERVDAQTATIVLYAEVDIGNLLRGLRVTIDPWHDCAPLRMEVIDLRVPRPSEIIEVTRLRRAGDTWIPMEGVRIAYALQKRSEADAFLRRLPVWHEPPRDQGFALETHAAMRAMAPVKELPAALHARAAAQGERLDFACVAIGDGPMIGRVTRIRSFGQPIDPARLTITYPRDAKVIDGFHADARVEHPEQLKAASPDPELLKAPSDSKEAPLP